VQCPRLSSRVTLQYFGETCDSIGITGWPDSAGKRRNKYTHKKLKKIKKIAAPNDPTHIYYYTECRKTRSGVCGEPFSRNTSESAEATQPPMNTMNGGGGGNGGALGSNGSSTNVTAAGSSGGGSGAANDEAGGDASSRRQATRVFKKSSSNGKITVYLGKRDFVDHVTHVDPIDGVVFIDPEYVKDRKVFGQVLAAFRYGREDLDVLGLTFRKDLYLAHEQIYPPMQLDRPMTRLQERLIKKLGPNAHPFYFEVPPYCPASVSLQPAPGDVGKSCGVDYELKAFVGEFGSGLVGVSVHGGQTKSKSLMGDCSSRYRHLVYVFLHFTPISMHSRALIAWIEIHKRNKLWLSIPTRSNFR